jgi:mono/diheme cytochrome c family protein
VNSCPRILLRTRLAALVAVVLAAGAAGCGTDRRDIPTHGAVVTTDPRLINGQVQFMHFCYECHPGGSAGLGPGLNDKPLPVWAMKMQVRRGFGAMPAFSKERIADPDLDDLIAYLKAVRAKGS